MKDSKILIEELKVIENNNNTGKLTHSQVISFCRATIAAMEHSYLLHDEFDYDTRAKIIFYLKLISAKGIIHRNRSNIADRCIQYIESKLAPKEEDWLVADF